MSSITVSSIFVITVNTSEKLITTPMSLQEQLILKIDQFCGIEELSTELEQLRKYTTEKKWFDNINFYFSSLYTQKVDVETHAVEYRQATLDTITFLEQFNKGRNLPTVNFLIYLINFKLSYVAGIRKIS